MSTENKPPFSLRKGKDCNHFDVLSGAHFLKRIPVVADIKTSILVGQDIYMIELRGIKSDLVFSVGIGHTSGNELIQLPAPDSYLSVPQTRKEEVHQWLVGHGAEMATLVREHLYPLVAMRNCLMYYSTELPDIDRVLPLLYNFVACLPPDRQGEISHHLPSPFSALEKWVPQWAISDDMEREDRIAAAGRDELNALLADVMPLLPAIDSYLSGITGNMSEEDMILSALAETVAEIASEELRKEISLGWDGPESTRSVSDILKRKKSK